MMCACVCSVALELTNSTAGGRYEAAASVATDNLADIMDICVVQLSVSPAITTIHRGELHVKEHV